MKYDLNNWLRRRLETASYTLEEPAILTYTYRKVVGPYTRHAGVEFKLSPIQDDGFVAHSAVDWPLDDASSEVSFFDGVIAALLNSQSSGISKVKISLLSIDYCPVGSSSTAFYSAGYEAVTEAIEKKKIKLGI
jgi:hypothetical protein